MSDSILNSLGSNSGISFQVGGDVNNLTFGGGFTAEQKGDRISQQVIEVFRDVEAFMTSWNLADGLPIIGFNPHCEPLRLLLNEVRRMTRQIPNTELCARIDTVCAFLGYGAAHKREIGEAVISICPSVCRHVEDSLSAHLCRKPLPQEHPGLAYFKSLEEELRSRSKRRIAQDQA